MSSAPPAHRKRPLRIAVEEAFVTREVMSDWRKVLAGPNVEPGFAMMGGSILADTPANALLHARLLDIGAERIAHMDEVGVDMQLLSMTAPGVQVFSPDVGAALAADANDQLAEAVRRRPDRLAGLGCVAPHAPEAAAREIGRLRGMGLKGLIINSHTAGEYLDQPRFTPVLEAAEAERLPIYLHPREPGPGMIGPFLDHGLYFATYGFAVETGLHALRLIMSGVFDRLPHLQIVLGHLGEGLPFWLKRIDNRHALQVRIGAVKPLALRPSEYFLRNFMITTAGMTSQSALDLCIKELGVQRIMFAADYPYEDDSEAVDFITTINLDEADRAKILTDNATICFGLDTSGGCSALEWTS